jgi:hypothetical protein
MYGYLEYLKLKVLKAKIVVHFEIIRVKVEIKFTVKQTTKAQRGSKGVAVRFL